MRNYVAFCTNVKFCAVQKTWKNGDHAFTNTLSLLSSFLLKILTFLWYKHAGAPVRIADEACSNVFEALIAVLAIEDIFLRVFLERLQDFDAYVKTGSRGEIVVTSLRLWPRKAGFFLLYFLCCSVRLYRHFENVLKYFQLHLKRIFFPKSNLNQLTEKKIFKNIFTSVIYVVKVIVSSHFFQKHLFLLFSFYIINVFAYFVAYFIYLGFLYYSTGSPFTGT